MGHTYAHRQHIDAGQLNIKFILLMNLSLVFALCVFFGLLHIIISHQKKRGFSIIYICLLILIIAAFFAVYLFL